MRGNVSARSEEEVFTYTKPTLEDVRVVRRREKEKTLIKLTHVVLAMALDVACSSGP